MSGVEGCGVRVCGLGVRDGPTRHACASLCAMSLMGGGLEPPSPQVRPHRELDPDSSCKHSGYGQLL